MYLRNLLGHRLKKGCHKKKKVGLQSLIAKKLQARLEYKKN